MALSPEKAQRALETAERLCSAAEVSQAVARLADEITVALARSFPLVLGVMRGSVIFAGQLLPRLEFLLEFDYLDVTRYREETRGGDIAWKVTPGTAARRSRIHSTMGRPPTGSRVLGRFWVSG